MKHSFLSMVLVYLCLLASCTDAPLVPPKSFTAAVPISSADPFIGTGGHGHTFPGASIPFGMVQLSPDTRLDGWDGCSGYHFTDSIVYGFSHTHLSGTGVSDYGDLLLMPTSHPTALSNGYPDQLADGYASHFDKSSEVANPGYYKVDLKDHGIQVELTAGTRCGIHRYTYRPGQDRYVIVDLKHRDRLIDAKIKITGPQEIEGYRISNAWAQEQHLYFVAAFSQPFTETTSSENGDPVMRLTFAPDSLSMEVKVGISSVSIEGARQNLNAELESLGDGPVFDFVHAKAIAAWKAQLNKVIVHGGEPAQVRNFYSALYHLSLAPNVFSDHSGYYRGMDHKIYLSSGPRQFSVFSLWDTFRAAHPLFTILNPDESLEFIVTFLRHYKQGGRLPVWELAANETDCMIGYHSVSVILDAYVKGIRGFDHKLALEAMVSSAWSDRFGLQSYQQKGFIGAADEPESVSKTLEYAYDDWCIAVFADSMEMEDTAMDFYLRSQNHVNLYDKNTGFYRARMNGGWQKPFDPSEVNFNFTEANAWQYSCFAPQDIQGMIKLHGGKEGFIQHLDDLFTAPSQTTGRDQADITGLIGQYAHGNEPSHHMAYLYAYAGAPEKGVKRIRQIMDDLYQDQPDGLSGNEDCGQMSAWYVFSALGFYPVSPGTDQYVLGSPIFPKTTIQVGSRKTFTIEANHVSPKNIYIQKATLNGKPLRRLFLRHHEIMDSGHLLLEMGPDPSSSWWDSLPGNPPPPIHQVPSPVISSSSQTFQDTLQVTVTPMQPGDIITFSDPKFSSGTPGPIKITLQESDTIFAWATNSSGSRSHKTKASFYKIDASREVLEHTEYAPEYAADGPQSLVNQLRGGPNFQTGRWQGYRGELKLVVDLGAETPLKYLGLGCLQDIKSWIWMPRTVSFQTSNDLKKWEDWGSALPTTDKRKYGALIEEIGVSGQGSARYISVSAEQFGLCPDWHLGAGGKTWIFADELIVQ